MIFKLNCLEIPIRLFWKKGERKNFSFQEGYTLIELLVVMTIGVALFSLGVANFSRINQRQSFKQQAGSLIEQMRLTQEKALSGEKPDVCGTDDLSGYNFIIAGTKTYDISVQCGTNAYDLKTDQSLGNNLVVTSPSVPLTIFFKSTEIGADLPGGGESLVITLEDSSGDYSETVNLTDSGLIYPL